MTSKLVHVNDTASILNEKPTKLVEILAQTYVHNASSVSSALKGVDALKNIVQFTKSVNGFIKVRKIKKDFKKDRLAYDAFVKAIEVIDEGSSDSQDKIDLVKSLFYVIANVDTKHNDKVFLHYLMQQVQELDSMDLMVLATCYKYKNRLAEATMQRTPKHAWVGQIVEAIDPRMSSMIQLSIKKLENIKLLALPEDGLDLNNQMVSMNGLSVSGDELCKYLKVE